MYYVEIPGTWVDEQLRAVVDEQLAETRDMFGLPDIAVAWLHDVGNRKAALYEAVRTSFKVFDEMGARDTDGRAYYVWRGQCSKGTMGMVSPSFPTTIAMRSDPEAYRPRRRRVYHETAFPKATYSDWQSQARGIVVHECVHCLQHATGIWKLMDYNQQERMAYTMQVDYPGIVRRILLERETHPNATFATAPVWATEATDYEAVLRCLSIRGDAGVYARYHHWLAETWEHSEQSA